MLPHGLTSLFSALAILTWTWATTQDSAACWARKMTDSDLKKKQALDELTQLGQEMEAARLRYEAENDAWWNSLTDQEQEDAFYAVIKRMYQAEVADRGTYRYALYNVFGFNEGMYGAGMDCGYMALHNIIHDGLDLEAMQSVDRIKVYANGEPVYALGAGEINKVKYTLNNDRALTIEINPVKNQL